MVFLRTGETGVTRLTQASGWILAGHREEEVARLQTGDAGWGSEELRGKLYLLHEHAPSLFRIEPYIEQPKAEGGLFSQKAWTTGYGVVAKV